MEEKTNGLQEQQLRRRRINKMKTSILAFGGIWILVLTVLTVTLLVKLISLEQQVDDIAKTMISQEHYVTSENQKNAGSKDGKVSDSVPEQEPATNSQENQPQVGEPPEESGQPEEHPRKVCLTMVPVKILRKF